MDETASSSLEKAMGPRGVVEDGLAVARETLTHWYRLGQTQTHRLDDFYQTGKEHSKGMILKHCKLINICINILSFIR